MRKTEREFLETYNVAEYTRPSLATDVVAFSIFNQEEENYRKLPAQSLNILLIKRGEHPFKDAWALPGGFVKPDETVEETAFRELQEETGVKDIYMEQLYTFSALDRDPRTRVMSVSYMALMPKCQELKAATDATMADWFKVDYKLYKTEKELIEEGALKKTFYKLTLTHEKEVLEAEVLCTERLENQRLKITYTILKCTGLAFDHAEIIAFAINRLRGKIEYTDIVFYLSPQKFTLTELQKIYEIVLDKILLPANFRRKIMDKVIETDEVSEGGGHRNAKLFIRNLEDF